MYFLSFKLFEVLKFIQFLMLFENQFLDTSSNLDVLFSMDNILTFSTVNIIKKIADATAYLT